MDTERELTLTAMQNQLLNLWFQHFLVAGKDRETAARLSHQQAVKFSQETCRTDDEANYLISKMINESTWVRMLEKQIDQDLDA